MALMLKTRASAAFAPAAGSRPACIRPLASSRSSLQVAAFRDGNKRAATGVTKKNADSMQRAGRGGTGSSSSKGHKQRFILPPNAPRNKKEESESVVAFVAVATLFLTGILFTFPALLGGSPATTTKPLQAGINKTFGIEDRSADQSVRGKPYAEGPGPAAAPGTAATR